MLKKIALLSANQNRVIFSCMLLALESTDVCAGVPKLILTDDKKVFRSVFVFISEGVVTFGGSLLFRRIVTFGFPLAASEN